MQAASTAWSCFCPLSGQEHCAASSWDSSLHKGTDTSPTHSKQELDFPPQPHFHLTPALQQPLSPRGRERRKRGKQGGNNHGVCDQPGPEATWPREIRVPPTTTGEAGKQIKQLDDFWQRENSRSGTDLFLLNASRFNQQIIGLIKRHPLLGQEPAKRHAD